MEDCNHKVYIGIDVHSRIHKVALVPIEILKNSYLDWRCVEYLDLESNIKDFTRLESAINKYVQYQREAAIAVDHTGGHYSEPLISFLQGKGYSVYNLEPEGMKEARERILDQENKSDITDAISAAYLLYLRDVHKMSFRISAIPFELGTKASYLRWLIIEIEQYNKRITQVTNRLHQLLYAVFPEGETNYSSSLLRICRVYPTPEDILRSHNLKDIKRIYKNHRENIVKLASNTVGIPGGIYREAIKYLAQQRFEAIARKDELRQVIESEVNNHPYGLILLSFPCFGPIAAAVVISIIKEIGFWNNKKKLKKAMGIYGTLKQSGAFEGRGRMGRGGSRHARRALFLVVCRCIQTRAANNNDFSDYYQRQVSRGKPKQKAIFSTMGKLAEVLYHCLSVGESYRYLGKYI